jgi:hypothetical protein
MKAVKLLVVVAAGGGLLSAGCLGGAYTLANVGDSGSTDIITREIPWDGSASMALEVPAVMRYVQAPGPGTITARGPHRSVSTLAVTGGHIHDQLLHTGAVLEITLTAPSVSSFYLNGRSRLTIESYDQDKLALYTEGAASVDVSGSAGEVNVFMQGEGAINLARLRTDALDGDVNGLGTLVAAPALRAKLGVSGSASAIMLTRPVDLKTSLEDDGRVIDAAPAS